MATEMRGRILGGDKAAILQSVDKLKTQTVDCEWKDAGTLEREETTLATSSSVTGPGTFLGRAQRTLTFEPTSRRGWWFDRRDLPESLPIRVSVNSVWTTARNIVLCHGSPHNYMRMVEHIIALRVGLGLDNVMIRMESGDPPLFDRSSMDLVESVDKAGLVTQSRQAKWLTVKEPVTMGGPNGSFLTFLPDEKAARRLSIDCAVDFHSAIGKQRLRFTVGPEAFRYGALARTNTTFWKMLYCETIGKIFADTRNLGYTTRNILVAGPRRYFNEPGLFHNGKSLEAVWHRATLDLLAAVALIERARFAGHIISYKAGHTLDVRLVRELYRQDLLTLV